MSIFENILGKIWHAAETVLQPAAEPDGASATASIAPAPAAASPQSTPAPLVSEVPNAAQATSPTPVQPVDVEAVLTAIAAQKGGGGNWQASIVDLLKLLDLDSSLAARTQLANEMNVHASADGTAEENVALHKAVMQKLADNGGKVPDSLKG